MAPPKPPKTRAGLGARLSAKVGPLPVWGWAVAILGAYLLYTRLHPAPAATPSSDTTATPDTSTSSDAQVPASGQGSPADNLSSNLIDALGSNAASIDALTSSLINTPGYSFSDPSLIGLPPDATVAAPASQPTTTVASHPAAIGAPPAQHPTQTQTGLLKWGGLTFTTKAAFDSWAHSHGSSTKAELNNHPQAKAIYSTLK